MGQHHRYSSKLWIYLFICILAGLSVVYFKQRPKHVKDRTSKLKQYLLPDEGTQAQVDNDKEKTQKENATDVDNTTKTESTKGDNTPKAGKVDTGKTNWTWTPSEDYQKFVKTLKSKKSKIAGHYPVCADVYRGKIPWNPEQLKRNETFTKEIAKLKMKPPTVNHSRNHSVNPHLVNHYGKFPGI